MNKDLELRALEEVLGELPERHELVHRLDQAVGDLEQLLERIGRPPGGRRPEAMAAERAAPVSFVGVEHPQVGVGVSRREPRDLVVRPADVLLRALLAAGARIDHTRGRESYERRTVVEDHAFVLVRKDVAQPLVAQGEVAVGRVAVEPRPVAAVVHHEARRRAFAAARAAAEVRRALEHEHGQTGAREVRGDDGGVMPAAEDDGVVAIVGHPVSRESSRRRCCRRPAPGHRS